VERKRYSRKFQRMAVARMETCEDVGELAREEANYAASFIGVKMGLTHDQVDVLLQDTHSGFHRHPPGQ
jgi:hypothetical protein